MSSDIAVFEHPAFGTVRMFEEDGAIYAVADDFAKALGYEDAYHLIRSLDPDEFALHIVGGNRGDREANCLTEAGMYHAILMRRSACVKDPATRERIEAFQQWVTHEVLPTIRRTGAYVNPYGAETREELLARANLAMQEVLAEREERIRAMEPMAALGEAVSAAENCIDITGLSRLLHQNGCDWGGRDRTYEHLRNDGYLMDKGANHNVPYQKWVEQGLFQVQEQPYMAGTERRVRLKTMVTPKGVEHLLKRYAPNRALSGLEGVGVE